MIKTLTAKMNGNTVLGRVKRTFVSVLPVAKNRKGACVNCGACCRLPSVCPFLRNKPDGSSYCAIYQFRPPSCRRYPRTRSEFLTAGSCGFRFEQDSDKIKN